MERTVLPPEHSDHFRDGLSEVSHSQDGPGKVAPKTPLDQGETYANPMMRRLVDLERELVAAKQRAEEHARELERCREAKRQLEKEMLVPLPQPPSQELEAKLEQAEARCALARSEMAEMQEKLRYYAQSQQAMEEDRQQVAQLAEELRAAKNENGDLRRRPGLKEASKKIAELRRQNEELNECLRKRHPDSLLALIKACEPPPEEKREVRDLKVRIAELEAQLQERDDMYDRRVRSLRAQYDHMRHEYQRRSEPKKTAVDLMEDVRRVGPDHEAVLQARIKDLERQVEHTKSYYLSKLRKREPLVPVWKPNGKANHVPQNPKTTRQVQQLQQQLQEREQRIAELEHFAAQPVGYPHAPPGDRGHQLAGQPPGGYPPPHPTAAGLVRLFFASPEGSGMVALCAAEHWLSHLARLEQYEEVAAYAEMLVPIFLAAESTAKGSADAVDMDMSYGTHRVLLQHDALRLEMPLLPSSVWTAWRHAMQRVAVASQSGLGNLGTRPKLQLKEALLELRQSAEAVIQQLLHLDQPGIPGESMLPRLCLQAVREDLDVRCEDQVAATRLLEEAEAQSGLDHRLPWAELLAAGTGVVPFDAVLVRSGISKHCVELCRGAARPDFSVSLMELRRVWRGQDVQPSEASVREAGLFKALARIRLAISRDPAALKGHLDGAAVAGFVPRGDFMEALRSLPCALSLEERHQIASLFSPAGDVHRVCYPLFLHSVMPERFEEAVATQHSGKKAERPSEWQLRVDEAEAESRQLREQLHHQEVRSAEQARQIANLGAEAPAQAVRRLQGEVAMLETKVLEQQAIQTAAARKSEIALRAELDVKNHEVSSLKRALEARDSEVCRYEAELGAIIAELNVLRDA